MITQTNSAIIRNTYSNSFSDSKDVKAKDGISISKQGDTSKVEKLKEAINSGEYQVDLQALSEKISEELL
ncbi:MAG: flagellar biosynthesis anti-sigma factor FlgM [Campylobacterales bacterium]